MTHGRVLPFVPRVMQEEQGREEPAADHWRPEPAFARPRALTARQILHRRAMLDYLRVIRRADVAVGPALDFDF